MSVQFRYDIVGIGVGRDIGAPVEVFATMQAIVSRSVGGCGGFVSNMEHVVRCIVRRRPQWVMYVCDDYQQRPYSR